MANSSSRESSSPSEMDSFLPGDMPEIAKEDESSEKREKKKMQNKNKKMNKNKQGGLKTMPCILATDVCDRFAMQGFNTNMITYLIQQLHMPLVQASSTLTNLKGTASVTPVLGGLLADSFAGRFWTITSGSIVYTLGMLLLTFTAVSPALRPPPCTSDNIQTSSCQPASSLQLIVLYMSLLLTSIGSGGIRPCVIPFGADQLDLDRPTEEEGRTKWSFFNLYYFIVGLAELLAQTVVVYVQEDVSWSWGLGVPTIAMCLSVLTFIVGYSLYVKVKPAGSPLTRLTQVTVAALRKRNLVKRDDPSQLLYENKVLDAHISTAGRLLHTHQLRFFDRAAVETDGDVHSSGKPRLWRLSTVHRVEELKSMIRLVPICAAGILLTTANANDHNFAIQQAGTMDRRLSPHFEIPPASLLIFSHLTILITLALYDRVLVPFFRRFTGHPAGITHLQRLGVGLIFGLLTTATAALVEGKRRRLAAEYGLLDKPQTMLPMSVFWLVPQYVIHGMSDALVQAAQMEFIYDQSPESMRSMGTAYYWLAISAGNYLGTFLVIMVHRLTEKKGDWLQTNINRGRLEYYYWVVTALQVINLVYFVVCALLYTSKSLEVVSNVEDDLSTRKLVEEEEEEEEGGGLGVDGDVELTGVLIKQASTSRHGL